MRIKAKANNKRGPEYFLAHRTLAAGSMKFDNVGNMYLVITGQDEDFRKGEYRYTVILSPDELEMIVALSTIVDLRRRVETLEQMSGNAE